MKITRFKSRILLVLLTIIGLTTGCKKENIDDDNNDSNDTIMAEYGVRTAVYKEIGE